MPLGSALSNFGLMSEGSDSATRARQALTAGEQSNQLQAQQAQTGQMGLEDATRVRADDASARTAAQSAAQRGATGTGTFLDMAKAYRARGDVMKASQFEQAAKTSEENGAKEWVHEAIINPQPGPRPDIVSVMNKYERTRDITSATLDDKGNLTISRSDGAPSAPLNVGVLAERLGLVKPWEKEVPAGGMLLRGNAITGKVDTYRNEKPAEFKVSDGIMWNDKTGAFQQVGQGDWKLGHIVNGTTEVPVAINAKDGTVQQLGPGGVRTGLEGKITPPTVPGGPTLISLPGGVTAEFKPATEAIPGKTNLFSPNTPATPAQPSRIQPVQPDTPPIEGARKAPDGKWYVKSGDGYAEVVPSGTSPSAKPAPKAAPKPAEKPKEEKQKPVTTPASLKEDDDLPKVEEPVKNASPAERHQSRVAADKAAQEKKAAEAGPKKAAETFRAVASSPRMTRDDIPLIKEGMASGLLTPAEMAKGERMLAKLQPPQAGMKSGGRVSREGLGG